MCGRFLLFSGGRELTERFRLAGEPAVVQRYNIAPTQAVAVIRTSDQGRRLEMLRWGLIPSWAKDEKIASRLVNARVETAADKPAFRSAFRKRRCLIPADGFYEWKTERRQKQPLLIRLHHAGPFAFAGLWESWHGTDGAALETCTILTTTANELIRPFHDRMPVIVAPTDYDAWLDVSHPLTAEDRLFEPFPSSALTVMAVSSWVNDVRHEGPQCLEPPEIADTERSLFD